MNKFKMFFYISVAAVIALFVLAFFYIDLSGHRYYVYDVYFSGQKTGVSTVDRYVTESSIIYKCSTKLSLTEKYPYSERKLVLDRGDLSLSRYSMSVRGARGRELTLRATQNGQYTSSLFIDYPRSFALNDFETGETTLVFDPREVMFYMPLLEKYDFWRKGTQTFEIMTLTDEPLPPLRDKLDVSYDSDEYILVMGKRTETEKYLLDLSASGSIEIFLDKYSHDLLRIDIGGITKFQMTRYIEGPGKRLRPLFDAIRNGSLFKAETLKLPETRPENTGEAFHLKRSDDVPAEHIFLDVEGRIISGSLFFPAEKKPSYPVVVLVQNDGVMDMAEDLMLNELTRELLDKGYAVLDHDGPGQGKSQGDHSSSDDDYRVRVLDRSIRFLENRRDINTDEIFLLGFRGGGQIALMAAEQHPSLVGCIVLGIPVYFDQRLVGKGGASGQMIKYLRNVWSGEVTEEFLARIADLTSAHIEKVKNAESTPVFMMGVKVPVDLYKQYLERDTYTRMVDSEIPVLFIFGRDDPLFEPYELDLIEKRFKEDGSLLEMVEIRQGGYYLGDLDEEGFVLIDDVPKSIFSWMDSVKKEEDLYVKI